MRTVALLNGMPLPALGLGTWRLGESRSRRSAEVDAVRLALEIGYRLIDTAEMYGDGGAETVVGEALKEALSGRTLVREELTIVTKVVPNNASRSGVIEACERSLKRLGIDTIDVYLLHWRGRYPLTETVAGFEALRSRGLIRAWGVSNFDVADLDELAQVPDGGASVVNQVYYSATTRGIEFDLLPEQRARGLVTMAYCPIDQGALASDRTFADIGRRHGMSAAQAALAWILRHLDVIAIPKASQAGHLRDNIAAAAIKLSETDLAAVDAKYPPPKRKRALAMT